MPKQVKTAAPAVAAPAAPQLQNLFVSVNTFDKNGKTIGERIVDMYHYGTNAWLTKHLWWSATHGHCTEIDEAKPADIDAYLAQGRLALAERFNSRGVGIVTETEAPANEQVAA